MLFFMQVLGGVVLAIIILVLGFFLYLKIKLGKGFSALFNEADAVPLVVQLNEDFAPDWLKSKAPLAISAELEAAGYAPHKAYTIPQMPGVSVASFLKDPVWVALYDHPMAGNWVDFVFQSHNGSEFTVTNSPMGGATERRPECKDLHCPELSAGELAARTNELLSNGQDYTAAPEDFREHFESAYAKDMQYRLRHGGMSREEFLGHVAETGEKVKDAALEEAFVETKLQELNQWHDASLQVFYKTLSENEAETLLDSSYLFIVPRLTYSEALLQYLADQDFIDQEDAEKMKGHFPEGCDIYAMFDRLNESRSRELRATLLAEATFPLDHKIYKASYD